ncbi:fibronectin type III domain-containing protein, partial [bacterium]|nr:fibronectin type III domain-containing protein [bacterium]
MNNKDNSIINVTDAGTIIGKISQNDLNTKSKRIYKSGLKNAVVYAIPLLTPIKYFIPSKGFPHATTFDDGKFIITGVSVRKYDLLIDGNGDNIADDRIFDVSVSKNNEIDVGEQIIMNFASSHNDAYKWTLDKKQYNLGDPMTLTLRVQNNFTSEVQVGYKIFRSKGEQHEVVENSFDINKFINIPGGKIPLGNTLSTTVDPSWIATNNSELVCYIVQSIYENGEYAGGNQIFQLFGFNVKLISPNGGEILVGTENITWLTSYNSSPSLKINLQYSSDNGTTWIDIISNVPNNGFYAWDTTQVIDGKEYLVRINTIDAVLNSSDTSEAVLSVDNFEEAPIVTLTSPNGGERWKGIQEITWTASDSDPGDSIENIDFQYSDDDGNNWVDIATVTENTGSYYWDLSLLNPGKEYKVRVKVQSGDLTNQDDSDNIFSVNAIGAIWEQKISSAEFSKRLYHSSISYDDRMWVIAGEYAGSCKNDVWYSSDG